MPRVAASLTPEGRRPLPQLITLHEAAERLSLSYWGARALVLRGFLPAVRLPAKRGHQRILIAVEDLQRFIDERREIRNVKAG
jgi:hypothetical protein